MVEYGAAARKRNEADLVKDAAKNMNDRPVGLQYAKR